MTAPTPEALARAINRLRQDGLIPARERQQIIDAIEDAAEQARRDEREECAKVADEWEWDGRLPLAASLRNEVAAAIRERSERSEAGRARGKENGDA